MKFIRYFLIIIFLAVLAFWAFRGGRQEYSQEKAVENQKVIRFDPANLSYDVEGEIFTLKNGKAEKESNFIGSDTTSLVLLGYSAYGDLDNDGDSDVAVWLLNDPGGTGKFYFGALVINERGVGKSTAVTFLGDRIIPESIEILEGKAVYSFLEREEDEPFTALPTVERKVEIYAK